MSDTTFDRSVLGFEAVRLLESLLERADETGRVQASAAALLRAARLTQGSLARAKNELTEHGLLRTEKGYSANGLRGANVYVLNLGALGATSAPAKGGESGQNRAEEPQNAPPPALLPVRGGSSSGEPARKGLWSRLFGGRRAS